MRVSRGTGTRPCQVMWRGEGDEQEPTRDREEWPVR